uniref:carboxy terminal-processing peptidase n=1 Tax=Silvanigrella sp. TaxID=2024976 RepID=UPI0037C9F438
GRGLILGDSRTFGKGTVQTVFEVPGTGGRPTDGAIHVTIAKFFRPSGKSNQAKGVLSDIIIPDIIDATDIGEKENDYALPYTTIKASRDFKPERDLKDEIAKLQQMSSERVDKSAEFKKIVDAINKARKDKNTLVSLKETKDSKDKEKNVAQNNLKTKEKKILNNKDTAPKEKENIEKLKTSNDELNFLSEDEDTPEFSTKVVRKNDIQLKEAANILLDEIRLTSNFKKD